MIVFVKNDNIYKYITERKLINNLIQFLYTNDYLLIEETILCIGNFLSDISFDSMKDYDTNLILDRICEILNNDCFPQSIIKSSFWLILTITRGITNNNYKVSYHYINRIVISQL